MQLWKVIVVDDDDVLYELDSAYMNENFSYDKDNDTVVQIGKR